MFGGVDRVRLLGRAEGWIGGTVVAVTTHLPESLRSSVQLVTAHRIP